MRLDRSLPWRHGLSRAASRMYEVATTRFGRHATLGLLALCAASAARCSSNETPGGAREILLSFDAQLAGERVACGKALPGAGKNARGTTLKDLRLYVHDVRLLDPKGNTVKLDMPDDGAWQYRGVALLDFEDKTGECSNGTTVTNALIRGNAPPGEYTGISFRIGVPPELSHGDTGKYRAPLTATPLYWGWLQGFIFFRLDLSMAATGDDAAGAFEVHLGADTCMRRDQGFGCARENIAEVKLTGFDVEKSKIVLDLGVLLEQVSVARRNGEQGVPGCVSGAMDEDCQPVFSAFGLDLASGKPAAGQSAFVVRPRETNDPGRSPVDDAGTPQVGDAASGGASVDDYVFQLPIGFSPPLIPADNPLTKAKVELGRHLFYDTRLSANQTQSCASCHRQELAFTDGEPVGIGSTGEKHPRSSMSLANVAYTSTLTWANPMLIRLEDQAHVPMFGEKPVELGLSGMEDELVRRLRAVDKYVELFPAAFPQEPDPFTVSNVKRAIASFERTLISGNSPYDRYLAGDSTVLNDSAKRGMDLFFDPDPSGTAVECFHCHGGPTLSDQLTHANQPSGVEPFHNTGLYNLDFEGSYPMGNQGLFEFSGVRNDKGRFKAPTLRNIAVTAPYMHDGSIATLEDVVAHYAGGGRSITTGPNAGDGRLNRNKSEFVHGFSQRTPQERADIVEFLKSLTDEGFLRDPRFANPWQ